MTVHEFTIGLPNVRRGDTLRRAGEAMRAIRQHFVIVNMYPCTNPIGIHVIAQDSSNEDAIRALVALILYG